MCVYDHLESFPYLFAEYMLTVDPDKRPDIYQASYVAFKISGRETPIQNLHVSIKQYSEMIIIFITDCLFCSSYVLD